MRLATFLLVSATCLCAVEDPVAAVLKRTARQMESVKTSYRMWVQSGRDPKAFHPDCKAALAQVEEDLKRGPSGEHLEVLLVSKLFLSTLAELPASERESLARRIQKEVPGRSRAWAIDPGMLAALATPAMEADALASNPEFPVKAHLLEAKGERALRTQRVEEATAVLHRLQAEGPKDKVTQRFAESFDRARKTFPGTPVPAFLVRDLDNASVTFTPETFKGKYVLLDFWATWCGPCKREMPELHQAWARFKGKPFEILSLSFDPSKEEVRAYRKQVATPMPWRHAFVESGFDSSLAKAFGVNSIPRPVLVGPDGRIVASGDALRGEDLIPTLERHLGK